jgi:hypothetical protein
LSRSRTLLSLFVALVAVAAFARVIGFGFVYDDGWTIVENSWLTRPLGDLFGLLSSGKAIAQHVPDATRPLMVLVHALERRVFGLSPRGYHVDSLLLYGVVCALATRLAWVLTQRRPVALAAGLFFALAPLHAEPVAAINYREDLYAALGMFGTLALVCAPPERTRRTRRRRDDSLGRAFGAGALLALGLFGKESTLAVVPLLAVIALAAPSAFANLRARPRALLVLGAVLFVWLAWRVPLALHGDDIPLAPRRQLEQMLLRTARFEVLAVKDALWPFAYSPDHWRQPDASFGWLFPCLSLVAGVLVLSQRKDTRLPALGVGIALTAPLLSCPLLRPINEFADRYWFPGLLGGGIVWGWALARLRLRFGRRTRTLALAAGCVPLLIVSFRATSLWRDDRALWSRAVELTPGSPRAWAGVSRVHRLAREREGADFAMQRALNADPNYGPALVTEVYNDLVFGRVELAREHLAALDRRHAGDGGGIAKAKHCAALDREAARHCIGP